MIILIAFIVIAACAPIPMTGAYTLIGSYPIPSLNVVDQSIIASKVIIPAAYSNGPGWVVIHSNVAGIPGAIIGFAPLVNGENLGVEVVIDTLSTTKVLYAMLHKDGGEPGKFEFPGEDGPVFIAGKEVHDAFMVDTSINISDYY